MILDQTLPDYLVRLHPSYWAEFKGCWQNYFVSVARVVGGKVVNTFVPILPLHYRTNPTVWPKGDLGLVNFNYAYFFDFQPSKLNYQNSKDLFTTLDATAALM